jgi:hypothetical protein
LSGISDYADLMIATGEQTGQTDIADLFPRLVRFAETKLKRHLRIGDGETNAILPLVNSEMTLPADFYEARDVRMHDGARLIGVSLPEMRLRAFGSGPPSVFCIVGNLLKVRPRVASGTINMWYYAGFPSLTETPYTNWLLARASDVYLYAVCVEVGIATKNTSLVEAMTSLLEQSLTGLRLEDERERWGMSTVVLTGVTP